MEGCPAPAVLTGGLAMSRGICKALSKSLGQTGEPVVNSLYAVAVGAACLALEG